MHLGSTLIFAGAVDEAIIHLRQAIRLNPFPEYYYYYHLGRCYMMKGQYKDALAEGKKAVQLAPDAHIIHLFLAYNYALLDREEEARTSLAKTLQLEPTLSVAKISRLTLFKNQADIKFIIHTARKAGVPE